MVRVRARVATRDVTDSESESDGIQHFPTAKIRRILKIRSCQIQNFCSTVCWLWKNIMCICLRSLGQIHWKCRPKYGRSEHTPKVIVKGRFKILCEVRKCKNDIAYH